MIGNRHSSSQRGFTMIEVLVALALFAIVSAVMTASFLGQMSFTLRAEERQGAIAAVTQALDQLRLSDPSTLPTSGSATQTVSAGEREYQVVTIYCQNSSLCGSSSRHIVVSATYRNQKIYEAQTVFARLR